MRNRWARSRAQLRAEVRRLRARLAALEPTTVPDPVIAAPARSVPILAAYPAAILVLDTAWQICFWNRAAEQLYGWSRDDVLSRAVGEVVPMTGVGSGADGPAAQDALQRDGIWGGEVVQHHRDGHELTVHVLIQRVAEAAGVTPAYLAIHHEPGLPGTRLATALAHERALLERWVAKRTDALRVANAELARAARLKDEFLANMSHELRTPLNTILGRAELLQAQVYGVLSAEQDMAIRGIEESGRHLLALMNDILDLSKIEAGRLELQLAVVEVEQLCQQCLRMVAQPALQHRLTVSLTIDAQVTSIQADERRLKQILVNLLSNAVQFTPEGGQIGLEVQGDPARQALRFTVWDTGIGIAPDHQRRLFQPFVQIDPVLSRQHAGAGLGLALVLRLAQLHDGGVSLDSRPGAGSRFTVTLPWVQPGDERSAPAAGVEVAPLPLAQPGAAGTPPRILLAEDQEANSAMLQDLLTRAGYMVEVARDGPEALQQAEAGRPDLIVIDIQLPGIDGLEVIRRIRAGGLRDMPIIALTALAMPGDRERCLAAGANAYLAKPVSLRTLLAVIATQLGQPAREGSA